MRINANISATMDQQSVVADIERRAAAVNLDMGAVCGRAKIAQSTFSRWKLTERNPKPKGATMPLIERLYGVIGEEEDRLREELGAADHARIATADRDGSETGKADEVSAEVTA